MADRLPLILIPPSEGKAVGGTGEPWVPGAGSFPSLDPFRARVQRSLGAAMKTRLSERQKLLGVKGAALALATTTNLAVRTSATSPAIERYTGVLYDALDAASLSKRDRLRLDQQVIIFSGLWGLVRPTDPIPDYKLKMGATLKATGRLASYWKPRIDAAMGSELVDRTVWNLLPNEHDSAWSGAAAAAAVVSVRFLDEVGTGSHTKLIVVSHWNKLLKGALVRHVLAHQLADVDGLADFEHPEGYSYRPDLTVASTTDRGGNQIAVSLVARR